MIVVIEMENMLTDEVGHVIFFPSTLVTDILWSVEDPFTLYVVDELVLSAAQFLILLTFSR